MGGILVADDSPTIRTVLVQLVKPLGVPVFDAADGDAAWSLLQSERPVVALLDISMPGQGGLQLTRAIRADPVLRGTAVILVSAMVTERQVREGLAAGADRYVTKPFSPRALRDLVQSYLHRPAAPGP